MNRRKVLKYGGGAFLGLAAIGAITGDEDDNSDADGTDSPQETTQEEKSGTEQTTEETEQQTTEAPQETTEEQSTSAKWQVRVKYDGEWSGSVGSLDSLRSIDGSGTETVDVEVEDEFLNSVSANAQKQDGSDKELVIQVLKNGNVVDEASTTAAYGMAQVTHET